MASQKKKNNAPFLIGGVVIIFIILLVVFGPSKEEEEPLAPGEYDAFAACLYEKGMRMYGSATCSFCARQRQLFGTSFEHVQEIECDPRNEGAQVERCVGKQISHTPTWILEDEEGNDIHRFESGVVELAQLAEVSGCEFKKDTEL